MGAVSSAPRSAVDSLTTMPRRSRRGPPPRYGARPHSHGSFSRGGPLASPSATFQIPGIRCYQCHAIFHSRAELARQTHHCRCPYCSAINGVPAAAENSAHADASIAALAAAILTSNPRSLAALESNQQEQLLRRLQSRDISPLVRAARPAATIARMSQGCLTNLASPPPWCRSCSSCKSS